MTLATSIYQLELGYDPPALMRVGALHMPRLVRPGSIVRTSYDSGPYVVVSMTRGRWLARNRWFDYWCFTCDAPARTGPHWPRAQFYLNEFVAVGRRILGFMNDDEIVVVGFSDEAARKLRPAPVQLDLFA